MKTKALVIFCSILMLIGCSSTASTKNSMPAHEPSSTREKPNNSIYDGVRDTKVKECMGAPVATFKAHTDTYWRYFTPNRCEVLFVIDNESLQVVDMKYLFPHGTTRYGYAVSEKQCPLAQKQCLLSK